MHEENTPGFNNSVETDRQLEKYTPRLLDSICQSQHQILLKNKTSLLQPYAVFLLAVRVESICLG